MSAAPLLEVRGLVVEYPAGRRVVQAVSGVSFAIARGETLGLVGESGCGKSSLARALPLLTVPRAGSIRFDGVELTALRGAALRRMRRRLQLLFQDPVGSLNPRRAVADIVAEPLRIAGLADRRRRAARVREALAAVGLDPDAVGRRRPHEFSGGQCQRIGIARALAAAPELLICDEAVSALDVSIRAQIINLLEAMKARYRLTLLFIAHDLATVKAVSDRVAVMYLGRLCEIAATEALYRAPAHPYTATLLAAIPVPDPTATLPASAPVGEPPSPLAPPSGCRFRTRCPRTSRRCADTPPELREIAPGRAVACHHPLPIA